MFSRYNSVLEAGIGQVLIIGIVVLGFVQKLPPGIVIGATVLLAALTTFKVYWVSHSGQNVPQPAVTTGTRQRRVVETEEVVHDQVALPEPRVAESWREDVTGRHQRTRAGYAPTPRAVSRLREEAATEV